MKAPTSPAVPFIHVPTCSVTYRLPISALDLLQPADRISKIFGVLGWPLTSP
jgi:hypothetical protein